MKYSALSRVQNQLDGDNLIDYHHYLLLGEPTILINFDKVNKLVR